MNLTGANNFSENNDYTIYTVNSNQNGQYSVILPKNMEGQTSMLVDLNMKNDFDGLMSNTITKEALLEKLNNEYNKIKETNPTGILVIPMTDVNALTNAVNSNDKQKIVEETKKIGGITSELFKNLTESGLDKSKINPKIMIIEKNDIDSKFVDWLKVQMPDFVDGIKMNFQEEKKEEVAADNPFAGFNPFGEPAPAEAPAPEPAPAEPIPAVEPAPVAETPAVEPVPAIDPMQPAPPVEGPIPPTDIFGGPEPAPEPAPAAVPIQPIEPAPVAETPAVEQVPTIDPLQPVPPVEASAQEEIIEPQPVNSVSLETTQAVPTVAEPAPAEAPAPQPLENQVDKKSGGFANILIILVILAVVTVASIELGKFLFNTFGT